MFWTTIKLIIFKNIDQVFKTANFYRYELSQYFVKYTSYDLCLCTDIVYTTCIWPILYARNVAQNSPQTTLFLLLYNTIRANIIHMTC